MPCSDSTTEMKITEVAKASSANAEKARGFEERFWSGTYYDTRPDCSGFPPTRREPLDVVAAVAPLNFSLVRGFGARIVFSLSRVAGGTGRPGPEVFEETRCQQA